MNPFRAITIVFVVASLLALAQGPSILRQGQTIPLPGVNGRFDHFSVDVNNKRLFVAALGNNTVELIDLKTGKREQPIKGLKEPQGLRFVPESDRLFVAGGGDETCRAYDTKSMKLLKTIELGDDADNVRYDADAKRIYVGYGSGALAAIDAEKLDVVGQVKLAAHPESFQLESKGPRIFVNVPHTRQIAVVDRTHMEFVAKWSVEEAKDNFPMSLDEQHHLLFVGCRRPAKLLVLNMDTGKVIAAADCCGDTDDLFYDEAAQRVYLAGGEGYLDVFDCKGGKPERIAHIKTSPGARTSLFVPELKSLFLAVPHRGSQTAEIRAYRAEDLAETK